MKKQFVVSIIEFFHTDYARVHPYIPLAKEYIFLTKSGRDFLISLLKQSSEET